MAFPGYLRLYSGTILEHVMVEKTLLYQLSNFVFLCLHAFVSRTMFYILYLMNINKPTLIQFYIVGYYNVKIMSLSIKQNQLDLLHFDTLFTGADRTSVRHITSLFGKSFGNRYNDGKEQYQDHSFVRDCCRRATITNKNVISLLKFFNDAWICNSIVCLKDNMVTVSSLWW